MKPLREWRAERLLSARDLGSLAGVSDKTVIEIELGRQVPTFRTMRRISTALDVPPNDIAEFANAVEQRGKDLAA